MLGLPTPADVAQARQQAAESGAPRQHSAAAPAQQPTASGTVVELAAQDNGHFNTHAEINGRPVEVMVDTGATMVALSFEDAERAGLYLRDQDFTRSVHTANGVARVAPVTLDRVSIGGITVRNVPAAVTEPGRLKTSLLGMSFLSRLSRFDMRQGRLVLQE
ncbi:TIGR02281 family clan AA aspartic protease [Hyphomicrobium sulfonivorans]|nr:TIGR02281 family clan AA aspartic protease [Hyphomicrobium sulfonivorans]NSL72040.1 TIGR02281 family clan AA aspartic protease [Hyphomicrobium sulfonivorans]